MMETEREIADLKARLARVEAQLQLLFRRLGISTREAPAAQASPEVLALARGGDRKGAIRAFMQETGAGLKDAKNFVEALQKGEGA